MIFRIIPRYRVSIYAKEIFNIFLLLLKRQLIKGSFLEKFEAKFADYIGVSFCLAVGSGRLGLRLILESLGLQKGDEIIVPAYTFYIVPEVIKKSGFTPVFVDINEEDYNIDAVLIENKITEKTKAIIATHIFGTPCELDKILEIARKHNLFVIEDCAQAIGAEYYHKKVGSFGDCAFFSFETVKPFHTFGGGMVTTNSHLLYRKLKKKIEKIPSFTYLDVVKKVTFTIIESLATKPVFFAVFIYPFLLGLSFLNKDLGDIVRKAKRRFKVLERRFANFQAASGFLKIDILESQLNKRVINAKTLISDVKNISFQKMSSYTRQTFSYLAFKSNDADNLLKVLFKNGIDVDMGLLRNCNMASLCPVAQKISKSIVLIPVYPQLSAKNIKHIAYILNHKCKI